MFNESKLNSFMLTTYSCIRFVDNLSRGIHLFYVVCARPTSLGASSLDIRRAGSCGTTAPHPTERGTARKACCHCCAMVPSL